MVSQSSEDDEIDEEEEEVKDNVTVESEKKVLLTPKHKSAGSHVTSHLTFNPKERRNTSGFPKAE